MISQALRIHETTVLRHIKDYLDDEKLEPENGGSTSHLKAEQTVELIEILTINTASSTIWHPISQSVIALLYLSARELGVAWAVLSLRNLSVLYGSLCHFNDGEAHHERIDTQPG